MSFEIQSILQRLPEPIRNDPKKSGLLAGLAVVMCVLGIRQFASSGGPAKANAAEIAPRTAASPTSASRNARGAKVSDNALGNSSRLVADWLGTPIKALDRNLFETKLEFFQRLDSTASDKASVLADETFWDQLAKSLASQADQKRQKQIRSENLQLAASSLKLQTTIMGSVPKALIDGRMVRVGELVDTKNSSLSISFRVSQIEARRIVVEHDGVKIELRMGSGQARVITE